MRASPGAYIDRCVVNTLPIAACMNKLTLLVGMEGSHKGILCVQS